MYKIWQEEGKIVDEYYNNERAYPKRILMIASQEITMDIKDGGKKVSNRNYELLKAVFGKENVKLIMFTNCLNYECKDGDAMRLKSYRCMVDRVINIFRGRLFTGKQNEEWVIRYVEQENYNIVFLDRSLFGTLAFELKKNCIKSEIWTFAHNVESNYFYNKLKKNALIRGIICRKIKKSERVTFENSDKIFSLTNRDADLIKTIYDKKVNFVIPVTFQDKFCLKKCAFHDWNKKELLFIGSMFGPNYDGIKWFCRNVMKELPEYTLKIVGKGFESKRSDLEGESDNIQVIGTVDDLEKYYYADNVIVMPIFYGEGQKVKTAEAMMYGKVILASDEALEGYHVQGVEGILRCNSKDEFVNSIRMLHEKIIWDNARNSVRSLFLKNYEFEHAVIKCRKEFGVVD